MSYDGDFKTNPKFVVENPRDDAARKSWYKGPVYKPELSEEQRKEEIEKLFSFNNMIDLGLVNYQIAFNIYAYFSNGYEEKLGSSHIVIDKENSK